MADISKITLPDNGGTYDIKDAVARSTKQDKLVSGTTIKTFNGESILTTGDIPYLLWEVEQQIDRSWDYEFNDIDLDGTNYFTIPEVVPRSSANIFKPYKIEASITGLSTAKLTGYIIGLGGNRDMDNTRAGEVGVICGTRRPGKILLANGTRYGKTEMCDFTVSDTIDMVIERGTNGLEHATVTINGASYETSVTSATTQDYPLSIGCGGDGSGSYIAKFHLNYFRFKWLA